MSFNNVGHLITSAITTLQHFATLNHTSRNYTSLHLSTFHFLSFTKYQKSVKKYNRMWSEPNWFRTVTGDVNTVMKM